MLKPISPDGTLMVIHKLLYKYISYIYATDSKVIIFTKHKFHRYIHEEAQLPKKWRKHEQK